MLTVRANTMRSTRTDVIKVFRDMGWHVKPTRYAPHGIRFLEPPVGNLFKLAEFKKGHFEV